MTRYWVSWWSGNYAEEGCTAPPFKFWVTGQKDRPNYGLSPEHLKVYENIEDENAGFRFLDKHGKNDCSLCAVIDAESEQAVWELVAKHFPDYEQRFCEERAPDYQPGSRFL